MTILQSTRNPRVRAATELRDRRERDRRGQTLVDGIREVTRALASGIRPVEVFADPGQIERHPQGAALLEALAAAGTPVYEASEAVLERVGFGDRSEGVVAVIETPSLRLAALDLPADALVVVLEGVEKPGNLGAVLRSADGARADAVILADARTDLFNPNAIRASLGTIFAVPLAAASSSDVRGWLEIGGIRMAAARVDAARSYTDLDLRGPSAIVLGSEAHGLGPAWTDDAVASIRLPMLGIADSLNVSIAAAVLLYEARRQRDASRVHP